MEGRAVRALRRLLVASDTKPRYDDDAGEYYVIDPLDGSRHWGADEEEAVTQYLNRLAALARHVRSNPDNAIDIIRAATRPDNVSAEALL